MVEYFYLNILLYHRKSSFPKTPPIKAISTKKIGVSNIFETILGRFESASILFNPICINTRRLRPSSPVWRPLLRRRRVERVAHPPVRLVRRRRGTAPVVDPVVNSVSVADGRRGRRRGRRAVAAEKPSVAAEVVVSVIATVVLHRDEASGRCCLMKKNKKGKQKHAKQIVFRTSINVSPLVLRLVILPFS